MVLSILDLAADPARAVPNRRPFNEQLVRLDTDSKPQFSELSKRRG
jgi:hypothetical protein